MERKLNFTNINRNRNMFTEIRSKFTRNNVVAPEILVSHVWMQDEEPNGVEIIELNSSSDSGSTEEQPVTFSEAWDCVDNSRFHHPQDYQINKIAREKRRLNNNENPFFATYDNYYHDDSQSPQNGDFLDHVTDIRDTPLNHQINCFTIINNHVINSDSSSEQDYASLGVVESEHHNNAYWDHVYDEDRPKYDTNSGEKRTIWIYSFKNKHLLSENNFELVDIPGIETLNLSSSSSTSDEMPKDKSVSTTRIGSPIPPNYIPRLNLFLGQTLSTVTEIPELKLVDSEDELKESHIDSWVTNRREKSNKPNDNIINWLALSPRERRRRFKITEVTRDIDHSERETTMYMEGNTQVEITDTLKSLSSSKVQVHVDVHAVDDKVNTTAKEFSNDTTEAQCNATFDIPCKIHDDTVPEIHENINTPRINLKSSITKKSRITSPIQKLDSNNWIIEESVEKETRNFNYDELNNTINTEINQSRNEEMDAVSKRLYAKSLKFVRASDWNAFLPITGSPNSLQLSISCSTIYEKRTWLQKLSKYFKCCR